jgi:hypothetical protein
VTATDEIQPRAFVDAAQGGSTAFRVKFKDTQVPEPFPRVIHYCRLRYFKAAYFPAEAGRFGGGDYFHE